MMKLAAAASMGAARLAALPVALSSGGDTATFDISSVMDSAVKTTQSQLFSVLGTVVPAIVAITAAVVGIKFGIGWLRKIRG
ncbi:MAG: hypothetical protein NC489_23660 [Ruminococcus flavefaciens]|nr:hypothetical protein [Ruminococcus flavefaciens]